VQELECDPKAADNALNGEGKVQLTALRHLLNTAVDFSAPTLEKLLHAHVKAQGLTFKKVGLPLRVALTGVSGGPSLPDIMQALGRTETLARLDRILQ
jgi:glutamyl-tRNA synthetase